MNPALAIAISAIFFATIHGNLWQGISAFILGSFFGYVYYKTGSLKLTMLMHCGQQHGLGTVLQASGVQGFGSRRESYGHNPDWDLCDHIHCKRRCFLFLAVRYLSKISLKSVQGNCDVIPGADDIDNGENL